MRSLKESPGIGWMGCGSMDSMEADVGREDMERLLGWSDKRPGCHEPSRNALFFQWLREALRRTLTTLTGTGSALHMIR